MKFAIDIPNFGLTEHGAQSFSNPRFVAELAYEAEAAGWDGFFVWDHIGSNWAVPIADPWLLLAAIAMRTERIKLGPMVTPIPRRRPWKLAREITTLDQMSNGRVIMGVGIGGGDEYSCYNEPEGDRLHAAMLDEGLDLIQHFLSGERFSYHGEHYHVRDAHFLPKPVQPRIPIWIAGNWPNKLPMRRAARWDGAFPLLRGQTFVDQMPPETMQQVHAFIHQQRTADQPFDLIHWGITTGTDTAADADLVERYAAAGVTWWLENLNLDRGTIAEQRERIRRGPPQG